MSSDITVDKILSPASHAERRTKIICTLGPSCWSKEMLVELIDRGMNVARLNFSHGSHEVHANTLANLSAALAERPGNHVAILLDTKGPEIRTGFLKDHQPVKLVKGSEVVISTDYEALGDETMITCSYKSLPTTVQPGMVILAADGNVTLKVKSCEESSVTVEVLNDAVLGERKNMNLPGAVVDLPTVTEKDEDDLVNFGLAHGVDFVAASFVRKGSDIDNVREVLGLRGRSIKIIAKIENQEGLHNFDEILKKADGVMVARGDLGMEIAPEKVFMAQKMMIRKANLAGKTVITATQMLESMIQNPRPTRAECTDVANAVLDGTDCVMLSGETAGGEYPKEAVDMMSRVCVEAERMMNYREMLVSVRASTLEHFGSIGVSEGVASSAVKTATDVGAGMLVVLTETGTTARQVAKYRPGQPILVLTASPQTTRQVSGVVRSCHAVTVGSMIGSDSILLRAAEIGKDKGWVKPGDTLIAIHGMMEAVSGSTNLMKVLRVPE